MLQGRAALGMVFLARHACTTPPLPCRDEAISHCGSAATAVLLVRFRLCTEASGLMGQCPDYLVCNQASHETRPCMPIWFASGSHGTMPRMPASKPLLGDALLQNTYNIHSSKRRESASVTTSGSHGLDERLRRHAQGCHVPQVLRAAPDHLQHVLPLGLRAIGTRCSARGCFSCRCRRSPGAT